MGKRLVRLAAGASLEGVPESESTVLSADEGLMGVDMHASHSLSDVGTVIA
jgi:hypothetical protein